MVVAVVVVLSGCSFMFVSGPPPNHEQLASFSCSESRAAPVVDTILAALQVLNLATAAGNTDAEWNDRFNGNPPISRDTAVPLYVATTVLTTVSAYYGYKHTGECRAAKEQAAARYMQYAPPPYVPPGSPYAPASPSPYGPPGAASPYAPPGSGSPYAPPGAASPYAPPGSGSPYAPPGSGSPYAPPGAYPPPAPGQSYPPPAPGQSYPPPAPGQSYPPPAPGQSYPPQPRYTPPAAPRDPPPAPAAAPGANAAPATAAAPAS